TGSTFGRARRKRSSANDELRRQGVSARAGWPYANHGSRGLPRRLWIGAPSRGTRPPNRRSRRRERRRAALRRARPPTWFPGRADAALLSRRGAQTARAAPWGAGG